MVSGIVPNIQTQKRTQGSLQLGDALPRSADPSISFRHIKLPSYCGIACDCSSTRPVERLLQPTTEVDEGSGIPAPRCLPARVRRAYLLMSWCAAWLCPFDATKSSSKHMVFLGRHAYRQWLDDLGRTSRISAKRRAAASVRAQAWQILCSNQAAVLRAIAGSKRDRTANLLRVAADSREDEASRLAAVADLPRKKARPTALSALTDALACAERSFRATLEAACLSALLSEHAAKAIISATTEEAASVLDHAAVEEVLYLARAGSLPIRAVTMCALAGVDDERALSLLQSTRCEAIPLLSATAVWAAEVWGRRFGGAPSAD